ncbi:MAG: hypothetical protein CL466_01575 [Acidimicrobiaceae bacterium]|nr:hypothetical protein [Acidimicrobiaceae bacterium]
MRRSRSTRLVPRVLAVMAILGLAAACGIPLDDEPQDLAVDLPDALLPAASTTTEEPAPPAVETELVQIYLARADKDDRMVLHPVDREIQGDGSINVILAEVFAGPSADEQEAEYVSPFAEGSKVVGTVLEAGLLEIHLDSLDGFPQDDSTGNRLAFAMLVCTAVDLVVGAEIDRVAILLDGEEGLEPINAPVSDGEPPVDGSPVNCDNYVAFQAAAIELDA